jgi:N6-L-threonylcarbamoyladenine synthase
MPLTKEALQEAGMKIGDMDVIAATAGPGLIGALLVGFSFAKGLALALDKPFIPVNHIEGHIYSGFLMPKQPVFPFLVLVVSGGHTLLILVKSYTEMVQLGTTVDDAAGEAFDKVAKMLGLGYPGGPRIQKTAAEGNSGAIDFPIASLKKKYHFSFSGIKTAVLRHIQSEYPGKKELPAADAADIAASFQAAVIEALVRNTDAALREYEVKSLSLVGGVAANSVLRNAFDTLGAKYRIPVIVPDMQFCGDNAAMIGYRAFTLAKEGIRYSLEYAPFASFKSDFLQIYSSDKE